MHCKRPHTCQQIWAHELFNKCRIDNRFAVSSANILMTFHFSSPDCSEPIKQGFLNAKTLTIQDQNELKNILGAAIIQSLPWDIVKTQEITDPFSKWRRLPKQNMFQHGHKLVRIPEGAIRKDLQPNIAYVVKVILAKEVTAKCSLLYTITNWRS